MFRLYAVSTYEFMYEQHFHEQTASLVSFLASTTKIKKTTQQQNK